jgi:hypothetical protein
MPKSKESRTETEGATRQKASIAELNPALNCCTSAKFACGASCLRRELPEPGARNFACGANYLSPEGGSNFACGANYPHQALKGGYFVFVWRVGT